MPDELEVYNSNYTGAQIDAAVAAVARAALGGEDLIGGGPYFQATLFVSAIYGNDETATRSVPGLPYATLTAAQDAAVAGDTIYVLDGIFAEHTLGRHLVNWYFPAGTGIQLEFDPTEDNSGGGRCYLFGDAPGGTAQAMEFAVFGEGTFVNKRTVGTVNMHVLYQGHEDSEVTIHLKTCDVTVDSQSTNSHHRIEAGVATFQGGQVNLIHARGSSDVTVEAAEAYVMGYDTSTVRGSVELGSISMTGNSVVDYSINRATSIGVGTLVGNNVGAGVTGNIRANTCHSLRTMADAHVFIRIDEVISSTLFVSPWVFAGGFSIVQAGRIVSPDQDTSPILWERWDPSFTGESFVPGCLRLMGGALLVGGVNNFGGGAISNSAVTDGGGSIEIYGTVYCTHAEGLGMGTPGSLVCGNIVSVPTLT